MSPRRPKQRHRGNPTRCSRFLFRDQSGAEYWISRRRAVQKLKDHLARYVSFGGGIKLIEVGHIRAAYSSKYLHDAHSPELRLYRDDLIKTIGTSRTGKPARAHARGSRDIEAGHVPMPLDGGGDEED